MPALRSLTTALAAAAALLVPAAAAHASGDAGVVLRPKTTAGAEQVRSAATAAGLAVPEPIGGGAQRAALRAGTETRDALRALRADPAIAWASADRVARTADFVPNDSGRAARSGPPGGWQTEAWNLSGPFGIRAPGAWSLSQQVAGRSGGRGITVAVLDTGVAYADRPPYRRSPDLPARRLLSGYDFVADDRYPNDANGHGTFVATTIAGAANNSYGMPGIAYAADILPVRVLNAAGEGSSSRIAEGIRYAVRRGARVINVSIELFDPVYYQPQSITAAPEIRSALKFAASRNAVVVGATGNSAATNVPSTTVGWSIIQVGGTTEHGCLGDYSNHGPGMDLVAPGGGRDGIVPGDADCRPGSTPGRNIEQVTFRRSAPGTFVVPDNYRGTSMAAPHVTGVVALLLATGRLGSDPKPTAVEQRLKSTARDLGEPGPDGSYGAGLLDAAAALGAPPQAPSR